MENGTYYWRIVYKDNGKDLVENHRAILLLLIEMLVTNSFLCYLLAWQHVLINLEIMILQNVTSC